MMVDLLDIGHMVSWYHGHMFLLGLLLPLTQRKKKILLRTASDDGPLEDSAVFLSHDNPRTTVFDICTRPSVRPSVHPRTQESKVHQRDISVVATQDPRPRRWLMHSTDDHPLWGGLGLCFSRETGPQLYNREWSFYGQLISTSDRCVVFCPMDRDYICTFSPPRLPDRIRRARRRVLMYLI